MYSRKEILLIILEILLLLEHSRNLDVRTNLRHIYSEVRGLSHPYRKVSESVLVTKRNSEACDKEESRFSYLSYRKIEFLSLNIEHRTLTK